MNKTLNSALSRTAKAYTQPLFKFVHDVYLKVLSSEMPNEIRYFYKFSAKSKHKNSANWIPSFYEQHLCI